MTDFAFPSWGPNIVVGNGNTMQAPEEVDRTQPAPEAESPKVEKGTKTKRQAGTFPCAADLMPYGGVAGYGVTPGAQSLDSNTVASSGSAMSLVTRRLAGTYSNYRRMRADGIVAIAREIADALVCTNKWSYEGKDEKVPPERVDLIKNTWEGFGGNGGAQQGVTLREFILAGSCWAKDYGNATFETVWGDAPNGGTTVTELLPCLPDYTKPLVYQGTRTFAGVRNWGMNGGWVDLSPQYCVRFIYDAEGGDLFGRSRMENCKDWIQLKWDIRDKIRTDLNTAIGNTMKVGYPSVTTSVTRNGVTLTAEEATAENEQTAAKIGTLLSRGQTVTHPEFSMADQLRLAAAGVDMTKVSAWKISRLETGDNNFDGFKVAIDLTDEQILFGFLVLPRSVKEAEHGAKADAEQHTDSMSMMAWRWISYVVGIVNNITDDILEQNYGKDARGSVRVKAAPITDDSISTLKEILKVLLSANPGLALKMLDLQSLLEKLQVKALPDFDQHALALQLAAQGATDALSSAERLRKAGYKDDEIAKIRKEKREDDAIPEDPDELNPPSRTMSLSADGVGRWVTIGGDGEGGGTHVFIHEGRIAKGPASLEGKKVSDLSEEDRGSMRPRKAEWKFVNGVGHIPAHVLDEHPSITQRRDSFDSFDDFEKYSHDQTRARRDAEIAKWQHVVDSGGHDYPDTAAGRTATAEQKLREANQNLAEWRARSAKADPEQMRWGWELMESRNRQKQKVH